MNVLSQLCAVELRVIEHALKAGDSFKANSAMRRMQLYKDVDALMGGATFWQEYELQMHKPLSASSKEDLVLFLKTSQPTPAQFNGALQQLKNHLLTLTPSLSVSDAFNEAALLLNRDPEFARRVMREAEERREAVQEVLDAVSPEVIDLTVSNAISNAVSKDSWTKQQLDSIRAQQFWGSAAVFISILQESTDENIKLFALMILLMINLIVNRHLHSLTKTPYLA